MGLFSETKLEVNVRPKSETELHVQMRLPGASEYTRFDVAVPVDVVAAIAGAALNNGRKSFYGSETSYAVADVKA